MSVLCLYIFCVKTWRAELEVFKKKTLKANICPTNLTKLQAYVIFELVQDFTEQFGSLSYTGHAPSPFL